MNTSGNAQILVITKHLRVNTSGDAQIRRGREAPGKQPLRSLCQFVNSATDTRHHPDGHLPTTTGNPPHRARAPGRGSACQNPESVHALTGRARRFVEVGSVRESSRGGASRTSNRSRAEQRRGRQADFDQRPEASTYGSRLPQTSRGLSLCGRGSAARRR